MRLIVASLVLVVLSGANGGCPVKCTCDNNSVNCISKNLEHVPVFDTLVNTPIIIDISGNDILEITTTDFSFETADEVREIYMNNSQITSIEVNALDELVNLQELYLRSNLLKDLPNDFVAFNENLILLDLSSNYFVDMPKINSSSIEVLALASCGVTNVDPDVLSGLPNLKMLFLHQNNIKYINPISFLSMPSGFSVKLEYNPWNCDCKTYKLFNYLNYRDFTKFTEPVQCLEPEYKVFIEIYNAKTVPPYFENCTKITADDTFLNTKEIFKSLIESTDGEEYHKDKGTAVSSDPVSDDDVNELIIIPNCDKSAEESLKSNAFYWYLLLMFGIPLSFILGLVIGIFVAYRYFMKKFEYMASSDRSLSTGLLPLKHDLPHKPNV